MSNEKNKSIKKRIEELEAIIQWFDSEEFDLERGVQEYKKAHDLAEVIMKDIETMKHTITVIHNNDNK